jgi:hypothetical protein
MARRGRAYSFAVSGGLAVAPEHAVVQAMVPPTISAGFDKPRARAWCVRHAIAARCARPCSGRIPRKRATCARSAVDASTRSKVVESVLATLSRYHVFPDVAAKVNTGIHWRVALTSHQHRIEQFCLPPYSPKPIQSKTSGR